MYRKLTNSNSNQVEIIVDGTPLRVTEGDSIAACLLASGISSTRTSYRSGQPRAPYCMMGSCFECLVEVDGSQQLQACMIPARDKMEIRLIRKPGSVE